MAKGYKKGGKGMRRGRGRRGMRRARDVADVAGASVRRSLQVAGGGPFVANQMYENRNTDLASYDRAVNIARAYQHFRIKKITITLKPYYDTYQSAAGAVGRPQAYFMVDKAGTLVNPSLEDLKQMGAKPRRFDESPISFSWRPSVLTADNAVVGGVVASQYKISPWLSTNAAPLTAGPWAPSTIDHLGIFWYIDQPAGNQQFFVELEVQFQFKKPFNAGSSGARVPSKGVEVAPLDLSPDGIQGGADGITIPIPTAT